MTTKTNEQTATRVFATLADVEEMESQLREAGFSDAQLYITRGRGKSFALPPEEIEARRHNDAVRARLAAGQITEIVPADPKNPRGADPASWPKNQLVRKYEAWQYPLKTQEERLEWDKKIRADLSSGADPKKHHHFMMLPSNCTPSLGVLDADTDVKFLHAVRAKIERAGSWLSISQSKGFHATMILDLAWKDVAPRMVDRQDWLAPQTGSSGNRAKLGDIKHGGVVLYKPSGSPRRFGEVDGLYTMLTGRDTPPDERVEGCVQRACSKMEGWRDRSEGTGRGREWPSIVRRLATELSMVGLGVEDDAWRTAMVRVFEYHQKVRPTQEETLDAMEKMMVSQAEGMEAVGCAVAGDEVDHLLRRAWAMVLHDHDGAIHVVPATDRDNTQVIVWDRITCEWRVHAFGAVDSRTGMVPFRNILTNAMKGTAMLMGKKPVDIGPEETRLNSLYPSLKSLASTEPYKTFDYDPEIPTNDDTGRGRGVVYYYLGGDRALRVSVLPEDIEAGDQVTVVMNRHEFMVRNRMTAPAPQESSLFKEKVAECLGGDEVAKWFRQGFAGALLPRREQEVEFFNATGAGSNGKSMLVGAYAHAFGEYALKIEPNAIAAETGEGRQLGRRRQFIGKRLVYINEMKPIQVDETFVKEAAENAEIPVGGMMREDQPRGAHFDALLVICSNDPLHIQNTGHAMFRRGRVIPFAREFPLDRSLPKQLMQEAPGIMRMMMNDLSELIEQSYRGDDKKWKSRDVPEIVLDSTRVWLAGQDVIGGSLSNMFCSVDIGKELWEAHQQREGTEGHVVLPKTPLAIVADPPLIKLGRGTERVTDGLAGLVKILVDEEGTKHRPANQARTAMRRVNVPPVGRQGRHYKAIPTQALVDALAREYDSEHEALSLFLKLFVNPQAGEKAYRAAFSKAWKNAWQEAGGQAAMFSDAPSLSADEDEEGAGLNL